MHSALLPLYYQTSVCKKGSKLIITIIMRLLSDVSITWQVSYGIIVELKA